MKVLFPEQKTLKLAAARAAKDHKWVIVQSATGSGKSVIMGDIIYGGLKKGKTFLVLTESKKIFNQLSNEFGAVRINSKTNHFVLRPNNVYVAMSQSLANRKRIIASFLELGEKLILMIDEAHIGTTKNVVEVFPCMRLGFTATPAYRWAKHLPELYNSIVTGLQIEELVQLGRLTPYRHIGRKRIDGSALQKGSNGEYTEASQERAFGTSMVYDGLHEDLKVIQYKCAIIYVASIEQCEKVYANLVNQGYNCAIFHSKVVDQEAELHKYHNDTSCKIMVSVAALTKGYDNPLIDLIILLRATTSLPLYLQMIGRGGRTLKQEWERLSWQAREPFDLKEKLSFTCLDYGLNFDRFGAWDSDRDWSELSKEKEKADKEAAPTKECPKCNSYLPTSARTCKWCGYVFPIEEKELQIGELVDFNEVKSKLLGRRINTLTAEEFADYTKAYSSLNRVIRVVMAIRQAERWQYAYAVKPPENVPDEWRGRNFLRDFGAAMGYAEKWYQAKTGDISRWEKEQLKKLEERTFKFGFEFVAMRYHNYIIL